MKKLLAIAIFAVLLIGCKDTNDGSFIEETGTLETNDVVLSSQTTGKVIKLNFDDGDKVNAGDTIYVIDPETYQLQLQQAEAAYESATARLNLMLKGTRQEDLKQAKANVKQAEISYNQAKLDKERFEKLYDEQAVTKKQYEDMVNRLSITDAAFTAAKANLQKLENIARPEEIQTARANVKSAKAQMGLLKKQVNNCYITAPFPGTIIESFIKEDEVVVPLTSMVKLADPKNAELTVYISELNIGKVKLGMGADIFIDTFSDKAYPGKVTYISSEAEFTPKNIQTKDERTKLVFAVKIEASNPAYELKAGLPADAKIYLN